MMIAYRYDAIVDECMALAAVWRERIENTSSDKSFHADQHRRTLLRAAMFARLAQKARDTDGSPKGPDRNGLGGEAATAGAAEGGTAQTLPEDKSDEHKS